MSKIDKAIRILQLTNDGNQLNVDELLLVEHIVNSRQLTQFGSEQFRILCDKIERNNYENA
jgi:hypothetical protein